MVYNDDPYYEVDAANAAISRNTSTKQRQQQQQQQQQTTTPTRISYRDWLHYYGNLIPLNPMMPMEKDAELRRRYDAIYGVGSSYRGGRRMKYKSTRRRSKTNRRRVKTHRRRHRKH